jgi:flagellar motor switch protein FliN/FliY
MADQDEEEKASGPAGADPVGAAYEIPVEVIAVLGTAELQVSQILKLGRGAVVELDRVVGEPIEIHANNQLIARGEVVVIEDRLGVQMTEIIKSAIG